MMVVILVAALLSFAVTPERSLRGFWIAEAFLVALCLTVALLVRLRHSWRETSREYRDYEYMRGYLERGLNRASQVEHGPPRSSQPRQEP
jgi:hypothetical protein